MNRVTMLFPGGKAKAFTLSYDDGAVGDRKLAGLISSRKVKATINLNSGRLGVKGYIHSDEVRALYPQEYFEVATHSCTHPFLDKIPMHNAISEIVNDRIELEKLMGRIIRGHAYPFGTYNSDVINVLKTAGIAYARTVVSTHDFKLPDSWYEWHSTCHHDDAELFTLADSFLSRPDSMEPALFYVWGHSYEFDRNKNWDTLERLLGKVVDRDDIWYATNIEIHDYAEAYRSLIWSGDCSMVYNPSVFDIWLSVTAGLNRSAETVCVKTGSTFVFSL